MGLGASLTIIDGKQLDRIFEVFPNASLTLFNLAITHGYTADKGGAIYNQGTISLMQTVLHDNTANFGGAIYNSQAGVAAIADSVFSNNGAYGKSGADGHNGYDGNDLGHIIEDHGGGYASDQWTTYSGYDGGYAGVGGSGANAGGGAIYNTDAGSLRKH